MAEAKRRSTRSVAFRQVRATRGKHTRAEPVSALYEQRRVHHVGMFAELEDQMCTWVPGEDSPDRMDALVWAMTDLMTLSDAVEYAPNIWS
jgi:phage terminase large subunit-like protein